MANLFAGGVGGSREEMCGAMTGALMAMSALIGRTDCRVDDKAEMALAKLYRERFLAQEGGTLCAPLRAKMRGPDDKGSCGPLAERAAWLALAVLAEAGKIGQQS